MLQPSDIGWGGYGAHRGPFYRGTCPFVLPDNPTSADRIMAVITACESGHYDAINMYDRAILSSGIIQWAEGGQFSVSAMLGAVYDARGKEAMQPLKPALDMSGAAFMKSSAFRRFRFYFVDHSGTPMDEVDTLIKQRMLFTGGSDEEGSWTDGNKLLAKTWAACVAEIWTDPENQAIQSQFTADHLSQFVYPQANQLFLSMHLSNVPQSIFEAAYAAYLSFAVNNPTIAQKHLLIAGGGWDGGHAEKWLSGMLMELTYGPGIAIYPARYQAIKPVLEKLYGVHLFEGVGEFSDWMTTHNIKPLSVQEAQELLIHAGYDLGPWGADGKFGAKTKAAVCALQHSCGLPQTGLLDSKTCEWLDSVQHP